MADLITDLETRWANHDEKNNNKRTCAVCNKTFPTERNIKSRDIMNLTLIIIFSVTVFMGVINENIPYILISVTGLTGIFFIILIEVLKTNPNTYESHIKDCQAYDESGICQKCKGKGRVTVMLGDGFDITEEREICPVCDGSGET